MTISKQFVEEQRDFFIKLTVEGTCYNNITVKVSNPYLPLREQIERLDKALSLPILPNGILISYCLSKTIDGGEGLLEMQNDVKELSLVDHDVKSGDHLYFLGMPVSGCVKISIDTTQCSYLRQAGMLSFEIMINNYLRSPISELIQKIKDLLFLPSFACLNPITYSLCGYSGYNSKHEGFKLNEQAILYNELERLFSKRKRFRREVYFNTYIPKLYITAEISDKKSEITSILHKKISFV